MEEEDGLSDLYQGWDDMTAHTHYTRAHSRLSISQLNWKYFLENRLRFQEKESDRDIITLQRFIK